MAYPIYHQNWDGAPATYADWNLSGSPSYSVGAPSYTSASNAVHCVNPSVNGEALTTLSSMPSADGTLTAYINVSSTSLGGVMARVQGLSLNYHDFPMYICYLFNNSASSNLTIQTVSGTTIGVVNYSAPASTRYFIEFRLLGTSLKARLRDQTNNLWLQSGGTWAAGASDAISITDSTTQTSGNISLFNWNGGVGYDDIYWDAPAPAIAAPSSFVSPTGTLQLTAGGFSDPMAGVTWGSSLPGVATVSAGGLVTGVAAGTTVITATGVRDTGQTATQSILVQTASSRTYPGLDSLGSFGPFRGLASLSFN